MIWIRHKLERWFPTKAQKQAIEMYNKINNGEAGKSRNLMKLLDEIEKERMEEQNEQTKCREYLKE